MATLKETEKKPFSQQLQEQVAAIEAERPVIDSRWYVVDYWASHDDIDGRWVPEHSQKASDYFKTYKEAEEFVSTHNPFYGAVLQIRQENLRQWTEQQWLPY